MRMHDVSGAIETIEAAPAKINLALHVTGQRADGYHLLETLVTFTAAGDVIRIRDADADSFSISGPFGDLLRAGDGGDNLVTRARDLLRDALLSTGQPARPVAIHLEKNLPVASGIGGGSADAAATLRGCCGTGMRASIHKGSPPLRLHLVRMCRCALKAVPSSRGASARI